jgi:integrase
MARAWIEDTGSARDNDGVRTELAALADAAGTYQPMILTLGYTGLRLGEAAGLQVGDVDLAVRRLSVNRAWARINTGAPTCPPRRTTNAARSA